MLPHVCILLALLCSLAAFGAGHETRLISVGHEWRYWKAETTPASNWFAPDFDDSTWQRAPGGFSAGIFGRSEEPTLFFDYNTSYATILFRTSFTVTDPDAIRSLVLRADWDDAFVAYLNGAPIVQRGLPGIPHPVPHNASAPAFHARGQTEDIDLSTHRSLLHAGTNILAVQVHNANRSSTFCWTGELLANFIRGPFLQDASSHSIKVAFKTVTPAASTIEWWIDEAQVHRQTNAIPTTSHLFTLPNLIPATRYQYRVTAAFPTGVATSPDLTFESFPENGAARFVVLGDSGSGSMEQMALAKQMRATNPDFVMMVGDVVYPYYIPQLEDLRLFSIYAEQMQHVPFFLAAGNHDGYAHRPYFFNAFYLPTNNVTGGEEFYSFDLGEAHCIVLDTDFEVGARYDVDSPQYRWLEADLAATRKPWKFFFFHHVTRSSAVHQWDDYNNNGVYDELEMADSICKLAERYGVQVIFSGHDHIYERFKPLKGVVSLTSGGGGEDLYPLAWLRDTSQRFLREFHFLQADVTREKLHVRAISTSGAVIDELVLHQPMPGRTYHAAEFSPAVELDAPNKTDGNIATQSFDLRGLSIPTTSGSSSTLGDARINHDATNLYVGFAHAMISRQAVLLLFIDAGATNGVTNTASLGNNVLDPTGQGADGLDLIETLSFAGFTPQVGVILGEEMSDSVNPAAVRDGGPWAPGQGVFQLNDRLTPISAARLQQFNNSPQTFAFAGESDADFIEVAIPWSALGGQPANRVVKVGAVVANFDPTHPALRLDTAALGEIHRDESGHAILAPIEVHLASATSDSDGDGLADTWELAHGLDPSRPETHEDHDRDGVSNFHEYTAGTHPADANSRLRLTAAILASGGVRLSWEGAAERLYTLEYINRPGELWRETGHQLEGGNGPVSIDLPAAQGAVLYRLRVTRR